jgi:hypothetical protein
MDPDEEEMLAAIAQLFMSAAGGLPWLQGDDQETG